MSGTGKAANGDGGRAMTGQKMRYDFLLRLFKARLTRVEAKMILYLCMNQNCEGQLMGLQYKNVSDEVRISYDSFYRVLKSLQEKGLITYMHYYIDKTWNYDVTVIGNDLFEGDYNGYMELGNWIKSDQFKNLKANEMLLVIKLLHLCKINKGSFTIKREVFMQTCMEEIGVHETVIVKYRRTLFQYFDIQKEGYKYIISPKGTKAYE